MRIVGAGLGRTGTLSLKLALEQLLGGPLLPHDARCSVVPTTSRCGTRAVERRPARLGRVPGRVTSPRSTGRWPRSGVSSPTRSPTRRCCCRPGECRRRGGRARTTRSSGLERADPAGRARSARCADRDGERPVREHVHARTGPTRCEAKRGLRGAQRRRCAPPSTPARLVDWQPGDGWEPICAALRLPVPDEPFPHVNTTADFRAMIARRRRPLIADCPTSGIGQTGRSSATGVCSRALTERVVAQQRLDHGAASTPRDTPSTLTPMSLASMTATPTPSATASDRARRPRVGRAHLGVAVVGRDRAARRAVDRAHRRAGDAVEDALHPERLRDRGGRGGARGSAPRPPPGSRAPSSPGCRARCPDAVRPTNRESSARERARVHLVDRVRTTLADRDGLLADRDDVADRRARRRAARPSGRRPASRPLTNSRVRIGAAGVGRRPSTIDRANRWRCACGANRSSAAAARRRSPPRPTRRRRG